MGESNPRADRGALEARLQRAAVRPDDAVAILAGMEQQRRPGGYTDVRVIEARQGELLAWRFGGESKPPPVATGCLGRFIRLAHGSRDDLVAFAEAWGPLGLGWVHGPPQYEPPERGPGPARDSENIRIERDHLARDADANWWLQRPGQIWFKLREPVETDRLSLLDDEGGLWEWWGFLRMVAYTGPDQTPWVVERLDGWRRCISQMRAILGLASNLYESELGPEEEWRALLGQLPDDYLADLLTPEQIRIQAEHPALHANRDRDSLSTPDQARQIRRQRLALQLAGSFWLMGVLGSIWPMVVWDTAPPVLQFRLWPSPLAGLLPTLALQLATALQAPLGLVRCDECGQPYSPLKRRPPKGRRKYCPDCSQERRRAAKRQWWRANRGQQTH